MTDTPRPRPNLSADPRDHQPPHHDPPSRPDMNAVMLEVCRRHLGVGRHPELEPPTLPPAPAGQLILAADTDDDDPQF